jgi:hypothetical protein
MNLIDLIGTEYSMELHRDRVTNECVVSVSDLEDHHAVRIISHYEIFMEGRVPIEKAVKECIDSILKLRVGDKND